MRSFRPPELLSFSTILGRKRRPGALGWLLQILLAKKLSDVSRYGLQVEAENLRCRLENAMSHEAHPLPIQAARNAFVPLASLPSPIAAPL